MGDWHPPPKRSRRVWQGSFGVLCVPFSVSWIPERAQWHGTIAPIERWELKTNESDTNLDDPNMHYLLSRRAKVRNAFMVGSGIEVTDSLVQYFGMRNVIPRIDFDSGGYRRCPCP